jgi:hypothetical protein
MPRTSADAKSRRTELYVELRSSGVSYAQIVGTAGVSPEEVLRTVLAYERAR